MAQKTKKPVFRNADDPPKSQPKTKPQRGELIAKGKTKVIYAVRDSESLVIMASNNNITKNDDPGQTKVMPGKGMLSTTVTARVFEILKKHKVPVAYEKKLSSTEILARKCQMIQLEVIVRGVAAGNFLKRCPEFGNAEKPLGKVFAKPLFELFLKTSGHAIKDKRGTILRSTPVEDPFIFNPYDEPWVLKDPKLPYSHHNSNLEILISPSVILPDGVTVDAIETIARRTFILLEAAWLKIGHRLIDFKIEFGVTTDGELVVADVIDNDSWRLSNQDGQDLSKQAFRDNLPMTEVRKRYYEVVKLIKALDLSKSEAEQIDEE